MIECLSMFYQTKPARQISSVKHPADPRSITKVLALAFNEWLLMFMLFLNSIFSYLIKTFADYSQLQSPCLMCSRLDHILGKKCVKTHWDMICAKHKSEISSLVYCHDHGNLVDVRGMCESCLFSFATTNKSNAETYRLLVGKLGEDSCFGSSTDSVSTNPRYCTCCNQILMPRASNQVAELKVLHKSGLVSDVKAEKQATLPRDIRKKNVKFNHLPHVGYTELKIHSDTESEALFSEDEESRIVVRENHKSRTRHLATPVITLPYDLASDKLLNPYFPSQPFVPHTTAMADIRRHELEQDQELIPLDDVVETSDKVLKDKEIISLDDLFPTSSSLDHSAVMVNEREMIPFLDLSLNADLQENSADDLSRSNTHKTLVGDLLENELICLNDVPSRSDVAETQGDILKKIELTSLDEIPPTSENQQDNSGIVSLDEVPQPFTTNESSVEILKEVELISLDDTPATSDNQQNNNGFIPRDDIPATSDNQQNNNGFISFDEAPQSFTANESSFEIPKESATKKAEITSLYSVDIISSSKAMPESSTQNCEAVNLEMKETLVAEDKDFHIVKDEDCTTKITSEIKQSQVSSVPEMVPPHIEAAFESQSSSFDSMSVAAETNTYSGNSMMQESGLLDLADAYNIIVSNEDNNQESNGEQIEQWMRKDTSRVSEDLKALLTQISASRGIEFLSPRDVSPKISVNSDESKNIDDMQLLLQKRMLERNESNLSLDEVAVSEIEGESETDRLKRQVDHDRKLLTGLYKELEEERSASAIATNQAMAMITRLQEEKALFQMEALQNLRMMEEQAEYDMEAIQKLNDLLVEREKLIQDLEAEIEYYRDQTPQASSAVAKASSIQQESSSVLEEKLCEFEKKLNAEENATEIDSPNKRISNRIQCCLMGFNEERLYITNCLEKIENKLQHLSIDENHEGASEGEERHENGEAHVPTTEESVSSYSKVKDAVSVEDEVCELHERVEKLKGDLYFLEHVVHSLEHGDEGVQFVKEIASHLQTLRSLSMGRHHHTDF